ncbi:MAG: hypothetical protein M1834_006808 [Cirrosporium novae-zelandiae]|nr:MAG: hypothetical protein M1834_006808 [Cirrosporium novae-zelandiae]
MRFSSLSTSLADVFKIPLNNAQLPIKIPPICLNQIPHVRPSFPTQQASTFSSTAPIFARKKSAPKLDKRIKLIRYHLNHPKTPRPLRLSRLRSLRHWTIHRAYQLYRLNLQMAEERELERQYNCMRDACEHLRTEVGDGGRLFRIAMNKKNIWQGVPIEYARIQTESPPRDGWDNNWTR